MNQARRQAYLDALGIVRYVRRDLPRADSPGDIIAQQEDRVTVGAEQLPAVAATDSLPTSEKTRVDSPAQSPLADLASLKAQVESCQACELCKTRSQTVFGTGNAEADLMIIGEAPGADEDRLGEPFVGRAGQLLNAMLQAIGLRREDVYIANILKCRPPGNRNPSATEVAACQHFLDRQIELVQPRVILSLGAVSAQNLLHTSEAVGRLRRQQRDYGPRNIPLRVTYHPAYLLRRPEEKAKSWEDLQQLAELLS